MIVSGLRLAPITSGHPLVSAATHWQTAFTTQCLKRYTYGPPLMFLLSQSIVYLHPQHYLLMCMVFHELAYLCTVLTLTCLHIYMQPQPVHVPHQTHVSDLAHSQHTYFSDLAHSQHAYVFDHSPPVSATTMVLRSPYLDLLRLTIILVQPLYQLYMMLLILFSQLMKQPVWAPLLCLTFLTLILTWKLSQSTS